MSVLLFQERVVCKVIHFVSTLLYVYVNCGRGSGRGKKVSSVLVLACEGIRYTTRVIDCMEVGLAYTSWHMSVLTFVRYTESPSVKSDTAIGCS